MLILGLDLEGMNADITKGVQVETDRVTEVGAVLWDWNNKQPVSMISELINEADRLPISEDNTRITGITDEMLNTRGQINSPVSREENEQLHFLLGIEGVLDNLKSLMMEADYIMAHNGGAKNRPGVGYDYMMLDAMFKRYNMEMPDTLWIDTLVDLDFPESVMTHTRGGKSMMVLEHAHGFINPFPHRAVTDVLAMMKIASNYDIEPMIAMANSPTIELVWSMPYPNWKAPQSEKDAFEAGKAKAKSSGFKWNADDKEWVKQTKEPKMQTPEIQELLAELECRTRRPFPDEEEDVTPF